MPHFTVLVEVVVPVSRRERPHILLFLLVQIGGHGVLSVAVRAGEITGDASWSVLGACDDIRGSG